MTTDPTGRDALHRQQALDYHEHPRPGKLEIRATKPLANQRDLARAYSPGVAEASLAIKEDPLAASRYTARGNLVAVITNGSAVLGLGNVGALASKPVMEGKAVLFKKFANIDCFDIELNESDPERLADLIVAMEPTFGAINLEDIKSPDCFIVEKLCRERMNIPVFHDDQHGTAIVVGAAAVNALHLTGRDFADLKIVSTGGGAAGIACLDMLLTLGVKRENVFLCDLGGLVYEGRTDDMTPQKAAYAQPGGPRRLEEVIEGADLFLGLSGPGVLTPEMVARMAPRPIIFALANPSPEIVPDLARAAVPDALIATGRSDFPNQVNNVLCFPFIFRGALDVGAREINEEMKTACVHGIAELARASSSAEAAAAYQGERLSFGPEYLIPKPFDPAPCGRRRCRGRSRDEERCRRAPLDDIAAYREKLDRSVHRSALMMKPVFEAARQSARRIVFAEGEDERVIRAAQAMLEETHDKPILIGRPDVIALRCERAGLTNIAAQDVEIINPENDARYPRLLDDLSPAHVTARRGTGPRAGHHAHQHDGHRRSRGPARGRGQPDLRHVRGNICGTSNTSSRCWARIRSQAARRSVADDSGERCAFHRRHPCAFGTVCRRSGRDHRRSRTPCAPVRARAHCRALLAQPVRQPRQRQRPADARRGGPPRRDAS